MEPHKIDRCRLCHENTIHRERGVELPSFIGIDYHKRYSVFCVLDAQGGFTERGRIDHGCPEQFIDLLRWCAAGLLAWVPRGF